MLPTLAQCQEFFALINIGRQAADLPIREYLDFDSAMPGNPNRCLSATNLFYVTGWIVGSNTIDPGRESSNVNVPLALNFERDAEYKRAWIISEMIRRVTDPFDDECPGLRERLVEADVVRG